MYIFLYLAIILRHPKLSTDRQNTPNYTYHYLLYVIY
jgi:hypothetical protein